MNRTVVAFLEVFDRRFNVSSHLKELRAFLSSSFRSEANLIEYALSLSQTDFAESYRRYCELWR